LTAAQDRGTDADSGPTARGRGSPPYPSRCPERCTPRVSWHAASLRGRANGRLKYLENHVEVCFVRQLGPVLDQAAARVALSNSFRPSNSRPPSLPATVRVCSVEWTAGRVGAPRQGLDAVPAPILLPPPRRGLDAKQRRSKQQTRYAGQQHHRTPAASASSAVWGGCGRVPTLYDTRFQSQ
jgi:hypothetical protein